MRFVKFTILLIAVSLTTFCGCSEYLDSIDTELGTGYLLSPEDISDINLSFEDIPEEKFTIDENTLYYWTQGGDKFHIFKDCQALSRTDEANISSGHLEDAHEAKKEEMCSFCLEKGNLIEKDLKNNTNEN